MCLILGGGGTGINYVEGIINVPERQRTMELPTMCKRRRLCPSWVQVPDNQTPP